jgi:Putative adhesin
MRKEFEVSGPVELDVRLAAGEVDVDPALEGRVELTLEGHDDDSRALVDAARVELFEGSGGPRLLVDVPSKRGGFPLGLVFGRQAISCRIRCPEGSVLTARTKSADVTTRGLLGGVDVATASGDVGVDRVSGGLSAKSASGDVSAREVGGGVSIQTASGDVSVQIVRGAVSVQTASGDVEIREAYDSVDANTVSGDQRHGAVMRGNVTAHSVSGDVQIAVRRGSKVWLDCNTISGDTRSELELTPDAPVGDGPLVEIRAKTVSGDISITRAPAPANGPHPSDAHEEVHA